MEKSIIRLSKSCIGPAEKQAVQRILDQEYLGMGPEVQKFEAELSVFFNRPAVCVVNGTAALHLSLQACGLGRGDEVLVSSLTYIASFQAISATGATPIACDIHAEDYLIDLNDAERRITTRTKAIMPVHYTGGVGNLDAVYDFAVKHSLRVIEDAAHAFGTIYKNKRVGGFGDIACFSFDGIKNISSGEGGCIVTEDVDILQKVRDARLLGVEKDTENRFSRERSWEFDVKAQGWRYHMSDIMAAIGREQLKRFSAFSEKRQKIAAAYDRIFQDHPIIMPLDRDYNTVVPHIYVVRIIGMENRSDIQKQLLDIGIQVGYHYQPNHQLSYYQSKKLWDFPITEGVHRELLTLPLHFDLTIDDVKTIAFELKRICRDINVDK
ncbi:MAG: DegT/DnrJ/EryC1/StrS family aminotransferase [Candidatus Marinimicrobia bacterium]|nr:DegT/DnrJ/EryC1/StrS family aminotransferase [Candidatus Neomarinimicrobiota bacterium]